MKLLTKKNLLIVAAVLALVGFIGAFLSPLKTVMELPEYMGGGTLEESAAIGDVYFGETGTILPFLCFFLLLAGAVLLVLSAVKGNKLFALIAIVLLVVGALIPLFTEALYIGANVPEGLAGEELDLFKEMLGKNLKLGFGPILGAIGGFGGAAVAACATFVVKK